MPYSFFREEVGKGNVAEVTSTGDTIEGDFKHETAPPKGVDGSPSTHFKTERPAFADDGLIDLLLQKNVVINAHPIDEGQPLWQTLVFGFGPTILLVGLFVLLMRRAQGAAGGALGGFGRSRAKRYDAAETKEQVDFEDVAGIDEAEDELVEVVDFLRNPGRYTKLGASVPRGVLLSGPPGTGKTLLARAVAGEADVPFFSLSASEFIEAIVGVGASRVRDLFNQAKEAAPAIIFIDELDAIGRARGGGVSLGGHDEREQTLNQILTEMDGFSGSEGVIVIASTNRPEVLDPALLRPGRFDRRVTVNPPDQTGRRQILEVHTRGVPLAEDVDLAGDRLQHARHGRRRPAKPRERGRADRRPAEPREGPARRLHRLAREDRARRRAPDRAVAGRARAHRLPRVGPRAPRHAPARRRPGAQDLDHPARAGARRHLPEPREPTATATRPTT